MELFAQVLSDDPLFVAVNSYTTGVSPSSMEYMLNALVKTKFGGTVTADEIGLKAANRFQDILKDDLNVKNIEILAPGTPSPLDYDVKLNFRAAGPKFGKTIKEVSAALTANKNEVIAKARAGEAVTLTISTGAVEVTPDLIIMQALPNEKLAIAEEAGYWTAFDTEITEDLRIEAYMRDCMRKFQLTRKEIGLEIEDRITMVWQSDSDTLVKMFETWGEKMAEGLLCTSMTRSADAQSIEATFEGEKLTFSIAKV
jgi:isoleucyl-tRNA synthetase